MAVPTVAVLTPDGAKSRYADALADAGFDVTALRMDTVDLAGLAASRPSLVAVELVPARATETLELVRSFRQGQRTRQIPVIIYGMHLRAKDIESAARAGALWLQLEPSDGVKLVAAVRGILAAPRRSDQH